MNYYIIYICIALFISVIVINVISIEKFVSIDNQNANNIIGINDNDDLVEINPLEFMDKSISNREIDNLNLNLNNLKRYIDMLDSNTRIKDNKLSKIDGEVIGDITLTTESSTPIILNATYKYLTKPPSEMGIGFYDKNGILYNSLGTVLGSDQITGPPQYKEPDLYGGLMGWQAYNQNRSWVDGKETIK